MNKLPYKPEVKNKYHLKLSDIRKLKIGDRNRIKEPLFWRNNVISAWCVSQSIGHSEFCDDTSYWIGIYDVNAKAYKNKFRFYFSTYGGMCGYNFNIFYNPKDIENENDLKIQELFLNKINELIDNGILILDKGVK